LRPQQTIENPVELTGRGLFTGEPAVLRFQPAEADTGAAKETPVDVSQERRARWEDTDPSARFERRGAHEQASVVRQYPVAHSVVVRLSQRGPTAGTSAVAERLPHRPELRWQAMCLDGFDSSSLGHAHADSVRSGFTG
jgi:hypothetical protein